MRKIIEQQLQIGEIPIGQITIDTRSRDELPKILIGIRVLYMDRKCRTAIFAILQDLVPKDIDPKNGRTGMLLWRIFVLGIVKLACNWNYDKLHDQANNHQTLRKILNHNDRFGPKYRYSLQTIKDNVRLFTPEILDRINQIAIEYGHRVVFSLSENDELHGAADSFPVRTDVHFPTDISLLFDALRKVILLAMGLCQHLNLGKWRKGRDHLKKAKLVFLRAQRLNSSKKTKEQTRITAHLCYLQLAGVILKKAQDTLSCIACTNSFTSAQIMLIQGFINHGLRQMDQIRRRVLEGQSIPHHEKVFSLFQEHTEWIVKGKAGVPVELGLNVCIVKDQFGLILHHQVMQSQTDVDVAVPIIMQTRDRFPNFTSASFDKGFHSPSNQENLAGILKQVCLPRKGKRTARIVEIESAEAFRRARRKHAAVESSINGLEHSGLDICRDHGLQGFKRYVALGILARNIQTIGAAIQQKQLNAERKARHRIESLRLAA
jgi:hypothetical protein